MREETDIGRGQAEKGRDQTWNLSQAPQACLCKIILVRVKCLAKHTLFLLKLGVVCVKILRVKLTRVSLYYKQGLFERCTQNGDRNLLNASI